MSRPAPPEGDDGSPDILGEESSDEEAEWDELTQAERDEIYEDILRTIDYQTGGRLLTQDDVGDDEEVPEDIRIQPPGVTAGTLKTIRAGRGRANDPSSDDIDRVLERAESEGAVVTWTAKGGTETRYTLADKESLRYLHIWLTRMTEARELQEWAYQQYRGAEE